MKFTTLILATFILLSFYVISFAQAPDTLWTRTYGGERNDVAYSVQQTDDMGYIIGGYTYSFPIGNWNMYLIKTDSLGDSVWARAYGGSLNDYGTSVQQCFDGGHVISGRTNSYGNGGLDSYVIKTDPNGDTLWTRTYGGALDDYGTEMRQTADSGYVIAGRTASFGAGSMDVYMIKTDANGDTLWMKTFGGGDYDVAYSVKQTLEGGYILSGRTRSFGTDSTFDAYLIRTDANGDSIWTRTYGGGGYDIARSVLQTTPDSGFIFAGRTGSYGAGAEDAYLVKTDSDGFVIWEQYFGGINDDRFVAVQQSTDGGFIAVGFTESFGVDSTAIYIVRTDSAGDTIWTKVIGGNNRNFGRAVNLTSDNGYIIAGYTSSSGAGRLDSYLLRLGCVYVIGDVNGSDSYNGLDVTFGVSFFKGGSLPMIECECGQTGTWYVGGDVNGSCSYNGLDITYGVSYFKGGDAPVPCPSCPPN